SMGSELPAIAFNLRPRNGETLYSFTYGGELYVASYTTLPLQFGNKWQLFTITPLEDFTRTFKRHNNRLLLLGLFAIVLEIVVIYFLSAALSAPLERLARK